MKKITPLLASIPLITTACGGSSGSGDEHEREQQNSIDLTNFKGIWSDSNVQTYTSASGKQTTFQAPTALISSQEHMIVLNGNYELYVIEPGSHQAHFFSSFGYTTEITAQTSAQNSNFKLNFYNPEREANGELVLPPDGHYDSVSDVSTLGGVSNVWTDTYHPAGPGDPRWTFTFGNDGTFTAEKNIASCIATGSMSTIDSSKREFAVTMTFNGNCSPLTGTHTGLAWPSEGTPDNELNIAVYNGFTITSKAMGWKITR